MKKLQTKDYIYLDEELLNSHLTQFEKGLLTKEISEHGTESSDSESGSSKAVAGFSGILGIGAKLQSEFTEGDTSVESEFTKNIVENVLNDYAVDLLIQDCNENNVLCDFDSAKEGDFISYDSDFQIFDFTYLKSITDPECLSPILNAATPPQKPEPYSSKKERTAYELKNKQYNERIKNSINSFNNICQFSAFAERLCSNSVLVRVRKGLIICKRNKLRLNPAQISFENDSPRKIRVLGVVSLIEENLSQNQIKNFSVKDLDKISSILFNITLTSFDILHDNDKIIKPIAIYFEAD